MPEQVSPTDVIAFRLAAHGLTARSGDLSDAAGRCGLQNSPPGSAPLALHARADGVTQARMDAAITEDRSLLQTWAMRGAPFVVPTSDAAVFTAGVLPATEAAARQLLLGVGPALDRLGLTLIEAVELTRAELGPVLSGRRLAIGELGEVLAVRIAPALSTGQRAIWEAEGPYAAGQPLGEGVVHFCLRILTLQGVVCFAPRAGNKAPFVLVEEWLEESLPEPDPDRARGELLRRYLHCYGPSTKAGFAAWIGVRAGDVDPWWRLLEDVLVPVDSGGRAWLLGEDLDALRSAELPTGVRLLPPRDPYLQLHDRGTILDQRFHREVWKAVGGPGVVLVDGAIAGTWRPRKRGRTLTLTVTPFRPLAGHHQASVRREAESIGPLRGAAAVEVVIATE